MLSSQLDIHGNPIAVAQSIIESRRIVDEFEKADEYDKEYPAWIFLVDNVIKTYGNCPYLPPDKAQYRAEHIKMNPSVYEDAVARYVNRTIYGGLENEHQEARQELVRLVHDELANVFVGRDPERVLEAIVAETRWFQNQRSRTKAVTERWQQTLQEIDTVYAKTGINLALYIRAMYDLNIKYKASQALPTLNVTSATGTFESAFERFSRTLTARETEETHIARVRDDAIQKLAKLIRNGFKEAQTSKYKKRWNLLTDAQQLERIQSFANYYCLLNNDIHNQTDKLVQEVTDRLANKKLKSSDIKWTIKEGIIKNIETLTWNTETGHFEFVDAQKTKPKARKSTTTKNSIDVSDDTSSISGGGRQGVTRYQLTDADTTRIHRLLLHCMTLSCGQSRDVLIDRVVSLFTRHVTIQHVARDYVSGILDNVIALTAV